MDKKKDKSLTFLFTLAVLVNVPLAILSGMLIYVQMAGEISTLILFHKNPLNWFGPVEDFFGEHSDLLPLVVLLTVCLYAAAWILSFVPRMASRPTTRLTILHAQMGTILAFVAGASLTLDFSTPGGIGQSVFVAALFVGYPILFWKIERVVGNGLTGWTQRLFAKGEYAAANNILAVAIRFQPEDIRLRHNLGLARFDAGDILGTIAMLAPLLTEDCSDLKMLSTLEECYRTERDWPKALGIELRILMLKPARTDVRVRAAQVLDNDGKRREALLLLREGLPTPDLNLLEALMRLLIAEGDIHGAVETAQAIETEDVGAQARAIAAYGAILEAAPKNLTALDDLANLFIRHQRKDEGYTLFEKIITHDPQRHDLRGKLVQYYRELEEIEKAEPHLQALLDADRDTAEVALLYGDILIQREEYDRALMHLQYAVENYPNDERFALLLGRTYFKTGALEEANYWAGEALERAESDENGARIRALQNHIRDALVERELDVWQTRCTRDPNNVEMRLNLIDALVKHNEVDRALGECDALMQSCPEQRTTVIHQLEELSRGREKNFRLLDYLADLNLKNRRWDEAFAIAQKLADRAVDRDKLLIEHCERILKLHPSHVLSLQCLGDIRLAAEDWPETLRIFEQLSDLSEEAGEKHLPHIFRAAQETGETEKAIGVGMQLVQADPQDLDTRTALIRLCATAGRYEEAKGQLEAAKSIDFYNADLVRLESEIDLLHRDKRINDLLAEIESNPDDAAKQLEAGDLLIARGDAKRAVSCYQHAARDKALKDYAGIKQGYALARLRMFDLAEETLNEASLNIPSPEAVETAKGLVYAVAGMFETNTDFERALGLYKKIFRVDAGFRDTVDKIEAIRKQAL